MLVGISDLAVSWWAQVCLKQFYSERYWPRIEKASGLRSRSLAGAGPG